MYNVLFRIVGFFQLLYFLPGRLGTPLAMTLWALTHEEAVRLVSLVQSVGCAGNLLVNFSFIAFNISRW